MYALHTCNTDNAVMHDITCDACPCMRARQEQIEYRDEQSMSKQDDLYLLSYETPSVLHDCVGLSVRSTQDRSRQDRKERMRTSAAALQHH